MWSSRLKLLLSVTLVLVSVHAQGQSFYSQRGLGLVRQFVSGQSIGLGGAGLALSDKITVNYLNPAALANLPVSFVSGNFRHAATSLESQAQDAVISSTNVSGVQFHLPLQRERISLGVGLMPYSEVEYNFESDGAVGATRFTETVEGDGGVNNVFVSLAVRPFNRLYLGASGLFYFGSLRNKWTVIFQNEPTFLNTRQEVRRHFTAAGVRFGAQFEVTPGWRLAAVFSPAVNLDVNKTVTLVNVDEFADFPDSDLEIPAAYGFGTAVFVRKKLLFAADYYVEQWGNSVADGYTSDSRRISLGVEYSARGNRLNSSFLSKTAWRLGFMHRELGLEDPVGEKVTETFGSFGLGVPIKWTAARLDFALEAGRRGSLSSNIVKESVVRFSVTATVGERWFFRGGPR